MGVNALPCISWQKWIRLVIFAGALALLIQPVSAIDYANLSYGTVSATPTAIPSLSNSGNLEIMYCPSGASVYLDGTYKGLTGSNSMTITGLTPGSHTVRITKTGYNDYFTPITVVAGMTSWVEPYLMPGTNSGSLYLYSYPQGATIYLDGINQGTTGKTLILSFGSHIIRLTKEGYQDYFETFEQTYDQKTITAFLTPSSTSNFGRSDITSNPSGANIYIDGYYAGITPKTMDGLTPGSHTVRVTLPKYHDYTTTTTIFAGQSSSVYANFKITTSTQSPAPIPVVKPSLKYYSSLAITSSPSGAHIYIDGFYRGITPTNLSDLNPGSHTVRIAKTDYNTYSTSISLSEGNSTQVSADLKAIKRS